MPTKGEEGIRSVELKRIPRAREPATHGTFHGFTGGPKKFSPFVFFHLAKGVLAGVQTPPDLLAISGS
jgi:hypothetical protein